MPAFLGMAGVALVTFYHAGIYFAEVRLFSAPKSHTLPSTLSCSLMPVKFCPADPYNSGFAQKPTKLRAGPLEVLKGGVPDFQLRVVLHRCAAGAARVG